MARLDIKRSRKNRSLAFQLPRAFESGFNTRIYAKLLDFEEDNNPVR